LLSVTPATPHGPEFQVNTDYTAGVQAGGRVACDAAGDYVISWYSQGQDGDGYGIYAQQYSAAGVPQGAAFQVNDETAGDQKLAAVAMDPNGDFVIAWNSYSQDGTDCEVHAKRYNAAGIAQQASDAAPGVTEFRVNSTTATSQSNPAIAMDAAGDFVITWSSFQLGQAQDIFAQRYDAAGVPQGGEFLVNDHTANYQRASDVAMDAAGDFIVTWESYDETPGSHWDVYAKRYTSGGAPQGSEFQVSAASTSSEGSPHVAMDATGNSVIAYTQVSMDGGNLEGHGQRYAADGTPQFGEFRVTAGGQEQIMGVALAPDDKFVVVFRSPDGSGNGIYGQQFDWHANVKDSDGLLAGLSQTPSRVNTVTTGDQGGGAVATDAGGNFVVTWSSDGQDGSSYGIFAQRFRVPLQVTGVSSSGGPIVDGTQLYEAPSYLTLTLSTPPSTDGGAAGAHSITNLANWRLTRNGVDVSGELTTVEATSDTTYVAHWTPTTSNGVYTLTLKDDVLDRINDRLNSVGGTGGQDFVRTFYVAPLSAGPIIKLTTEPSYFLSWTPGDVALSDNGQYLVAWTNDLTPLDAFATFDDTVALQFFGPGDVPFGPAQLDFSVPRDTPEIDSRSPTVAVDSAGNFYLAYACFAWDSVHGYLSADESVGLTVSGEIFNSHRFINFDVNAETIDAFGGPLANPRVDAGAELNAWLVDSRLHTSLGYTDFAFAYPLGIGLLGEAVSERPGYRSSLFRIDVAARGDHGYIATWQEVDHIGEHENLQAVGSDIWIVDARAQPKRVNDSHVSAGAGSADGYFNEGAHIAADAQGDFVVVWAAVSPNDPDTQQSLGPSELHARWYDSNGVPRTEDLTLGTDLGGWNLNNSCAVAMDDSGRSVITWAATDGTVKAQLFDLSGHSLGAPTLVSSLIDTGTGVEVPLAINVDMDSHGEFAVAWTAAAWHTYDNQLYLLSDQYVRHYGASFPTVTAEPAVNMVQNAATQIDLNAVFDDASFGDAGLVYAATVSGYDVTAVVDPVTHLLTLTPAANFYTPFGTTLDLTLTATNVAGHSVSTTVHFTVATALPTFAAGADVTLVEDYGPRTISGWATALSAGPGDPATQSFTYSAVADHPEWFSAQPTISPSGDLSFTPAPDANGTAHITVRLLVNGGSALGGADSAPYVLTIDILPVNDPPSFTHGATSIVLGANPGAQTIANWATNILAGPPNESAQAFTFVVTTDNPGFFAVQPAVSANGTLTYTPAPGSTGGAKVSVWLTDDGDTAHSGVNVSPAVSIIIGYPLAELPVNTATSGDQRTSNASQSVAIDTAGRTTVAWVDQAQQQLFLRRFDAVGTPLSAPVVVRSGIIVTDITVAAAPGGASVVVWPELSFGASLFMQRYDASGAPQGGVAAASTLILGGLASAPAVAENDNGYVVVWKQSTSSFFGSGQDFSIRARRFDAGGTALGSEIIVTNLSANDTTGATVAVDAAGNFVVAWDAASGDGSGAAVFAQRYNALGVAQGGTIAVNTFTTGDQFDPSVAMTAAGDFVVAWTSNGQEGAGSEIYAQRFAADGTMRGNEFRANTYLPGNQSASSVGIDSVGYFTVSWVSSGQDGSGAGVYAQQFDAAGTPLGGEVRLNDWTVGNQNLASVARNSNGAVAATWTSADQDGAGNGVFLRLLSSTSQPVAHAGGPFTLNVGESVNLSGTGSTGAISSYAWDLDNDGTFETAGADTTFTATHAGTFSVALQVTGPTGTSTDHATISVIAPPAVTRLLVNSTSWTPLFQTLLQSSAQGDGPGYAIPVGSSAQTSALSWTNLNQIRIVFSKDVSVQKSSLVVTGVNVASYGIAGFSYSALTHTATWTLAAPLGDDRINVKLLSSGPSAVTDGNANALDGEWTNQLSAYPSGNGTPGGDFQFSFNVLPASVNQDAIVNGQDIAMVASNWLRTDIVEGDANGDGIINGQDIAAIASLWLHTLPIAADAAAASAAVGAPRDSGSAGSVTALVAPLVSGSPAIDSDTVSGLSISTSVAHGGSAGVGDTVFDPTPNQFVHAIGRDLTNDGLALGGAGTVPPESGAHLTATAKTMAPEVGLPLIGLPAASRSANGAAAPLAVRDELFSRFVADKSATHRPTNALRSAGRTAPQNIARDRIFASEFAPELWPLHKTIRDK